MAADPDRLRADSVFDEEDEVITNDINDLIEAAKAVVESMHRNISIDRDSGETYHHPPDREECAALEAALAKVVGK